jgi:acyl carrier protein
MSNKDRYDHVFFQSFTLQPQDLNENLIYNSIPSWDSVGHMSMIAALETEFDIMMETDDIIDFSSYFKGFEILAKYDVKIVTPGGSHPFP